MTIVKRVRDWWLGRFRVAGGVGKVIWIGIPFLFVCCGLTMCSSLIAPPTPTAEVAERVSTVEVAGSEPVEEPITAPAGPTRAPAATDEPTATRRPPTSTPRPTETPTDEPTEVSARAAAAVVATVAAAQPTAAPATSTSVSVVTALPSTAIPATAAPTVAPLPTATLPVAAVAGDVIISSVRYDGEVAQVESDEYAVITNRGGAAVNIGNWRLNAGEPDQNFIFPGFDLQPGQSCRVYTNEAHPESCGFSFGRGDAIWRNKGDCGYLYNAEGVEVSRFCW